MYKFLFILLFCLYSVNSAIAERMFGQDFLGLQQKNFDVQSAIKHNNIGLATGNLDWTFGTDIEPVKKILNQLKPSFYRVHFINGPCIRNRNCGSYEYSRGLSIDKFNAAILNKDKQILNTFKERVKLYCSLIPQYPNTKFGFSPVLEHNLTPEAYEVLADVTLNTCPGVQLVNNPVNTNAGKKYKGAWIERHGSGNVIVGADIVSTDGEGISDLSIAEFSKKTVKGKYAMAWDRMYNCRTQSVNFVDPRARKECPKPQHFQLLGHIFDDRGPAPKFMGKNCKRIEAFNAPWVNKPFAENKGTGDPRADFPVIIVKYKSSSMNVLDFKGTELGKLGYYGTYDPLKGHRYYSKSRPGSGLSGYQFEVRARKSTGKAHTWLQVGDVCLGPVILGRRAGSYR